MTQLEALAHVVNEQMHSIYPTFSSPDEKRILDMMKKSGYAGFIVGYKTARDGIINDLKREGLLTEEQLAELSKLGEAQLPNTATEKTDEN